MTSAAMAARAEPPHSVVAEQAVLGSLLLENSALPRATEHLTERDFYNHEHRALFGTMVQLINAGQPADVITVFERMQAEGQVEAAGLLAHLNALAQSVPSASNVGQYAAKVREYAIVRDGMALGDELQAELKGALSQQIDPCTVLRRFAERLTDAVEQAPGAAFKLLTVADLQALPPQRWRIHSVLPAQGVAAVFGPSSTGKSFLVLDMTAAGCQGAEWFGYRVKPSKWLYVAMEGQAAFRHRVEAWEQSNDLAFPEGVRFLFEGFKLTERDDVLALGRSIAAAGGADVVVIDTLNRAAPEADENSSADMGRILEGVKELQALIGGLVVLVHHSGKDSTKGMRGHSSLFAALDSVIEVSRTDDRREWKLSKSKDGRDGDVHPFRLRVIDLGEDEDGEPITSCAVAAVLPGTDSTTTEPRARLPKGGNQKIVYDALGPLLRASTAFGKASAPPSRPCITLEAAIEGTCARLTVEPKRRKERAQQAITGLVASGVVGSNDGWLWLR